MTGQMVSGVAVLGGTFDPIHNGHLASARALLDLPCVSRVILVPSSRPPHREAPAVSASDRLEMARLAVADIPGIEVDDRELARQGPSYTVDTLQSLRSELGAVPIFFVLGADAFVTLPEWHKWQRLTDYAHLLVLKRPGYEPVPNGKLAAFVADRLVADPAAIEGESGSICYLSLTQVDISSTRIRELFGSGLKPSGRMPEAVMDFALQRGLYRRRTEFYAE